MSMCSRFRGQPVKVSGDKRYFIYYIERIYHPDSVLKAFLLQICFLFLCLRTNILKGIDMNKHSIYYLSAFLLALLAFFYSIFFTNPKNLPVLMLLIPVVSLFIILFLIFYWLIRKSVFSSKQYSINRSAFLATTFSIVPVLLLILASTRQFTFRDVCLSLILFFLIIVYFSKVDFITKK
jgi:hypothetical protein